MAKITTLVCDVKSNYHDNDSIQERRLSVIHHLEGGDDKVIANTDIDMCDNCMNDLRNLGVMLHKYEDDDKYVFFDKKNKKLERMMRLCL